MATYYTIQTWRNRAYEWETFNLYETFDEACDTIEGYMKAYADFDESEFEKIKPNREEKRKNIESWNRVAYLKMPNGEEKHIVRLKIVPKKQDKRQEFEKKWNQIPWEKRRELALAIQSDCRNIIAKIEASPFEEDHPAHLKNAKYVLHCCRSDAVEELGSGEVHPDWNEVHEWTQLFFTNDFYPTEDVFTVPNTKKVWLELTTPKKYVYQYFVRNNEQTEMKASPKYETFDEVCDVLDKELRKLHGESWEPRMTREQYKNYMGDAYAISYDFYKTDTYVLFRTEV